MLLLYICSLNVREKALGLRSGMGAEGPDRERLSAVLDRTGYSLDVSFGHRKYGGPPPNHNYLQLSEGCEVGPLLST